MINENDSAVLFQLTERWGIADYRKIAAEDLGMTGQGPFEYIWVLWNATPHINLYESFAVKSETDKFFGSLGVIFKPCSLEIRQVGRQLRPGWKMLKEQNRTGRGRERQRQRGSERLRRDSAHRQHLVRLAMNRPQDDGLDAVHRTLLVCCHSKRFATSGLVGSVARPDPLCPLFTSSYFLCRIRVLNQSCL